MNKVKIFENKNIIIYKKGEFMIGDEAEIANDIIVAAMGGYITFAEHLKEPMKFWDAMKLAIKQGVEQTEKEIKTITEKNNK